MATTVGPNPDIPGDDDGMYHAPGKPVETPATAVKYASTKMKFEMYEEVKRLAKILTKVINFLIRFERLRGIHIIIIFTWVQYQIGTLTFINIVSLSFLKTKFQNWVKCNSKLKSHLVCTTLCYIVSH
jgi:hypothetical protein